MELADLVAILNNGSIEQIGTPADIRRAPASEFVAEFVDSAAAPASAGPVVPFPEARAARH
jgi:ABC-type Fe3+/spermidine/putrescine transport system ATPase subunit